LLNSQLNIMVRTVGTTS